MLRFPRQLLQKHRHIALEHRAAFVLGVVILRKRFVLPALLHGPALSRKPSYASCMLSGSTAFPASWPMAWDICVKNTCFAPVRFPASIPCSSEKCFA